MSRDERYCKHGVFIGHPWGPDYLCGYCETGTDPVYPEEVLIGKFSDPSQLKDLLEILDSLKLEGLIFGWPGNHLKAKDRGDHYELVAVLYNWDKEENRRSKIMFDDREDDPRMDWSPQDHPGLSLADQYPEDRTHHPDCQCNVCYYGADLEKWRFHPSEY